MTAPYPSSADAQRQGREAAVLFLSYDGMTDPLGQSQVIPYLRGLSAAGFGVNLISCEKPDRMKAGGATVADDLAAAGIHWLPLRYTKRPPVLSTIRDVAAMWRVARRFASSQRVDLIHCRGYVPALVGRRLAQKLSVPFIFDMRGFWPEEKVDAGAWRLSNPAYRLIFRFFKSEERHAIQSAHTVVVLTERAKQVLRGRDDLVRRSTAVIPCAVDFDRFSPASAAGRRSSRARLQISDGALVVAYVGSLGTWYLLPEMLDFFAALFSRTGGKAHFLFITPEESETVYAAGADRGIPRDALTVVSASRSEVPTHLAAADLGISFIRPSWSKVASSPTKIGEYLAVGLPVVSNRGVGDLDNVLPTDPDIITVDRFEREEYDAAIDRLLTALSGSAQLRRERAATDYDLRHAIAAYSDIYRSALAGLE